VKRNAHSYEFKQLGSGAPMPLSGFAGNVLMVVNTASRCGFTPQLKKLQAVSDHFKDQGLVVIGVPCNDFGGQEPLEGEAIANFCTTKYSTQFPMTEKEHVTGPDAHPFYRWAGLQAGTLGRPRWNFHKFLIDANGDFADWYSTVTDPSGDKVQRRISELLQVA